VARPLKKDYRALAKKKIRTPSQVERLPKIMVFSRNKKGKTYLGVSGGVKRTLTIDPEEGTSLMRRLDPPTWHCKKWSDVDDAYKYLRLVQDDEDRPYDWANVDGLTKFHTMAMRFVLKQAEERDLDRRPGTITQKDYGRAGELMKDMIHNFCNLKMGVVFTSQERMEAGGGDDEDEEVGESARFVPDLPKGVRGFVMSEVDVIGRLYLVRTTVKGVEKMQRRLRLAPHEKYDTGYRSDYVLPEYVKNPTIPKLIRLMQTGEE
jgi:hypothetical protein